MFVYGTLRRGQRAWWRIEPHVCSAEPAHRRGTMYAFDAGYPGIVLTGDTLIAGELLQLVSPQAVLIELDAYEGDEFVRVMAEVETSSGLVPAWVYVVADASLATGTRIPGGDWCAHVSGSASG